jgi:hypothetical protein
MLQLLGNSGDGKQATQLAAAGTVHQSQGVVWCGVVARQAPGGTTKQQNTHTTRRSGKHTPERCGACSAAVKTHLATTAQPQSTLLAVALLPHAHRAACNNQRHSCTGASKCAQQRHAYCITQPSTATPPQHMERGPWPQASSLITLCAPCMDSSAD